MFLKPADEATNSPWPGEVVDDGGKAWVAFVDDLPVLGAEGSARFEVRRRRGLFGARAPVVVHGRRGVPARLRKGDTIALVMDGSRGTWRYDPDGNLGRWGRMALRAARGGTVVAAIAVIGSIGSEYMLYRTCAESPVLKGGDG